MTRSKVEAIFASSQGLAFCRGVRRWKWCAAVNADSSESIPQHNKNCIPHELTQLSHLLRPRLRFANVVDHESAVSPFPMTPSLFFLAIRSCSLVARARVILRPLSAQRQKEHRGAMTSGALYFQTRTADRKTRIARLPPSSLTTILAHMRPRALDVQCVHRTAGYLKISLLPMPKHPARITLP